MEKRNYFNLLLVFIVVIFVFFLNLASSQNFTSNDCRTSDFYDINETCRQCKECFTKRIIRIRDTKTGAIGSFIRNSQRMCGILYHKQDRDEEAIACMLIMARYLRRGIVKLANAIESDIDGLCGYYGLCNCLIPGADHEPIEEGFIYDPPDTTIDDILPIVAPDYVETLMEAADLDPNVTLNCEKCKVVAGEIRAVFPNYRDRKYWINSIRLFCYKSFPDSEISLKGCHWMFKIHQELFFKVIEMDLNDLDSFCEVESYCEKPDVPPPGFELYLGDQGGGACTVRSTNGSNEISEELKKKTNDAIKLNQVHFFVFLFVFCHKLVPTFVDTY